MTRTVLPGALVLLAAACAVGPNYRKPEVAVPAAYKELTAAQAAAAERLEAARPSDEAFRGKWWGVFGDATLDALEEQVGVSNQTIAQAEAAFRVARALVRGARAAYLPSVGATASATRSSGPARGSAPATSNAAATSTEYATGIDLSWEADVFGRIRRGVEAGVAGAQASAADLAAVRLAIQAELAIDYFTLRGLDAQAKLLESAVAGYETALRLTTNRYKQGIVSGVDVAQAQTQLETTRAQYIDLGVGRAQLEHAIAVLLGKAPADFNLAPETNQVDPPSIPVGLPSGLLERRPDIAGAERRVAGANATIGIAVAGYFPTVTLGASGGYQSTTLTDFISLPNRFWSLGPALLETLFDGGRRRAAKEQAIASYDATVAAYRQSVLSAFAEVEDDLATLRILDQEADQQAAAVAASERSLTMARNRYEGGITTYLEVVTAQTVALANERTAVDLRTRRLVASVDLVKALGGGWTTAELPYGESSPVPTATLPNTEVGPRNAAGSPR